MNKKKKIIYSITAFMLPCICFALLNYLKGIYPFGSISNGIDDMQIQYYDFFCYLKDILSGNAKIEYSFANSLGGSPIAIIGYYLLSPINLLLYFFDKSQIQLFVYVATSVKIGLCGLFFYWYISKRFKLNNRCAIMLSLAYSFTQYIVGQSGNLMWLDGVYLLPLIMLGIYNYVKYEKYVLFYITATATIIFCWYTGYMNCLFAVLYYFTELAINTEKFEFKKLFTKTVKFFFIEFLAVLLSCVVFLPVLLAQSTGRSFDEGVLKFATNGRVLDIFKGFLIGSAVPSVEITLFCTTLVLIFFFSFWFSKRISLKEKIPYMTIFIIMLASMFFKPLENIWCGFKFETSYQYRFAYIAFAVVIFIAAKQLEEIINSDNFNIKENGIFFAGLFFAVELLITDRVYGLYHKKLWTQIILIAVYLMLIFILKSNIKFKNTLKVKNIVVLSIVCIFLFETIINSRWVIGNKYNYSAQHNINYIVEQSNLIDNIKPSNKEFYRITQTSNRDPKNLKFFANESLAYGFYGIETYTSSYDSFVSNIIINSGYCTSEFPSFYWNPILPMDSYLGVRYLLSKDEYKGFNKIQKEQANGKFVYENKYALPLGFEVSDKVFDDIEFENSFEYANKVYSAALGENVEIYKPVNVVENQLENGISFDLDIKENSDKIFYIQIKNDAIGNINVNGEYFTFYDNLTWDYWKNVIVLNGYDDIKNVTLTDIKKLHPDSKIYIYYLDLDVFSKCIDKLKMNTMTLLNLEDGYINAEYTSDSDSQLLLSLPYNKGWKLKINDEKVEVNKSSDGFIVVPVKQGQNKIEMKYSMKGKYTGLILSIISILSLITIVYYDNKKKTKNS